MERQMRLRDLLDPEASDLISDEARLLPDYVLDFPSVRRLPLAANLSSGGIRDALHVLPALSLGIFHPTVATKRNSATRREARSGTDAHAAAERGDAMTKLA